MFVSALMAGAILYFSMKDYALQMAHRDAQRMTQMVAENISEVPPLPHPKEAEDHALVRAGFRALLQSLEDIAQKLGVSVKTVETHRTQLMARLGIHDLAGLVRYAIRLGLTTP